MKNISIFLLSLFMLSCENKPFNKLDKTKPFTGKITYNISYPYNQQDPFLNLYPTKLVAEINDTIIHSIINDIGLNINTYFHLQKHEIDQYVEIAFPYYKLHVHLTEKDILQLNSKSPKYKFKSTNITDSIGPCKISKTIATNLSSNKTINLWTTDDIKLIESNFFGPFGSLNKTLLQFEASNLGFKTEIRATKIEPCEIDLKKTLIQSEFQTISLDSLELIIANIFGLEE